MFKELAKLFGSSNIQPSFDLADRVRTEFRAEYIDNKGFVEKFANDIRPSIEAAIEGISKEASNKERVTASDNPVYHIFGGLKSLYISLWLEETGYGEKLALKMNQLLYTDDYGDRCFDDWNRELKRFVSDRLNKLDFYLRETIPEKYHQYARKLDMDYQLNIQTRNPDYPMQDIVDDLCFDVSLNIEPYSDRLINNPAPNSMDDIEDPYEYELVVANEFAMLGWNSRATSGSGDQGADVIAEKDGFTLVIQCKLYTSPVGNKAVQEVAAAKGYFHGDAAAVVTNSGFTKSARQLADSLGVYLLHHSQIATLDELVVGDNYFPEDCGDEEGVA